MPYTVNGEPLDAPEMEYIGGVPFVPLANIAEMLGGYVTWNNNTKVSSVEIGDKKVDVQLDNDVITVNESQVTLSSRPSMGQNHLWVPLELFQNVLGCSVSVDGSQVTISNM